MTSLEQVIVQLLVVGCTNLDPSLDDLDLTSLEKGTAQGHADSGDGGAPFELVNEVAVLWIAGNDAHRAGFGPARDVDKVAVRDRRAQVETVEPTSNGVVTVRACRTPGRIARTENLFLNAAEGRFEVRRWSCQVR